jgi:zinc/manganese transport system permease protein
MLYATLIQPFADYGFMRRALVGIMVLAVSGAPVGAFLLLRRMSLMGDALSHAILPGVAIAYLVFGLALIPMTLGGLVAAAVVVVASALVARQTLLKEDTALAAFYLMSLALGVTLIGLRGSNIDLMHVLFGSVLALTDEALILLGAVATITLFGFAALFRPLVLDTMDPGFLASISRRGRRIGAGGIAHVGFLMLAVLNLVAAFTALGSMLAIGMLILPAAAARFWSEDLTRMIPIAALLGMISGYLGLLGAYHLDLTPGPSIILATGLAYVLSLLFGAAHGVLWPLLRRGHLER